MLLNSPVQAGSSSKVHGKDSEAPWGASQVFSVGSARRALVATLSESGRRFLGSSNFAVGSPKAKTGCALKDPCKTRQSPGNSAVCMPVKKQGFPGKNFVLRVEGWTARLQRWQAGTPGKIRRKAGKAANSRMRRP